MRLRKLQKDRLTAFVENAIESKNVYGKLIGVKRRGEKMIRGQGRNIFKKLKE